MPSLVGEEVGPVAVPALGLHRPTSDRRSRSLPRRHGHGAYRWPGRARQESGL